jgi:ATP-dependent exoDNAse (exonuclease V) beta subunit
MKRIIVPGPPGTGKTYHLINNYLKKEIEEYKTSPDKIAYLTFSNAATNEAKKRILSAFSTVKETPGSTEVTINVPLYPAGVAPEITTASPTTTVAVSE